MKQRILLCVFGILLASGGVLAQDTSRAVSREEFEETEGTLEGIGETLAAIKSTVLCSFNRLSANGLKCTAVCAEMLASDLQETIYGRLSIEWLLI